MELFQNNHKGDNEERLIISSPLEAHKSSTICFDMVGLHVDYENPVFACLEIDFSELEDHDLPPEERVARKVVTFYELDLGLNTVTRKQLVEVDPTANRLVAVPGGKDGPGGVLVCSMNWVIYVGEVAAFIFAFPRFWRVTAIRQTRYSNQLFA